MTRYGYARVSSKTQDYSAQLDVLKAAGCERIFSEKRSGKSAQDRPKFRKLMRALVPGDTVVVSKLDRSARSSRHLHNILHELQERGCGFVSLGESWCDSTSEVGRLMLTIMGGIAEFERDLIRKRCEEGIERAKANGKQFGRPSAFGCRTTRPDCRALHSRRDNGGVRGRRGDGLANAASRQLPRRPIHALR
jgi:DNA invertase Pin-like site-specific DNA recombinase